MKSTEQYLPVDLFITLYKVVLTYDSVDEIPKCGHLSESYWAGLSVALFIMLYKEILTFEFMDEILNCDHLKNRHWAIIFCSAAHYAVSWVCG